MPEINGLPDFLREFDDAATARKNIYSNTLEALRKRFPVEDDSYRLELVDLDYDGPQEFSLAEQKKALLENRSLRTNIRGTWRLVDKATGEVLDQKKTSVMQVPYWTDRGTFINNGSEYTVISQSRLRPGVYARKKSNGEYEAQFNIRPGTGRAFHIGLEPSTGVMTLQTGQGGVPLYQVMKGLGVDDKEMARFWGADVAKANSGKVDHLAWGKLYRRMAGNRAVPNASETEKIAFVREALGKYEVDPEVVERTMGLRNVSGVTPQLLLRASQKLLNISRGDEQPDNRDNPRFSKFYGVEDYFKERVEKNAGRLANTLLYKAKRGKNLNPIQRNALNPWVDTIINGSGLAMPGEEANPLSTLEQMSRISKFGLGGIGSKDAVTMEARDVQGDYMGFVDMNSGPESSAAGVDVRASYHTYLGKDNKLYSELIDNRTGKKTYVDLATAADGLVAFPGQDPRSGYLMAIKDGVPQKLPASEVRYSVPSYGHMLVSNTNMNPMPTAVQSTRQFYGSKFWSQFLPQAHGEVPLVDSLMPDGKTTWSEYYGRKVGSLKSQADGVVTKVGDDFVEVKGNDGKVYRTDMVRNLPFNRMSLTGDTKVFIRRNGAPLCVRLDQYGFEPGDEVQSYDPVTCRSAWMPATGFTRHENGVRLYRVIFESGRHVDCTENHSLLTMANDFTLRPEYPKDCVLNQTKCPVVFASASNESEWTFEQGLLDGLYISEGCTIKQSSVGIKHNRSINKNGLPRKVRSDLKYKEPVHTLCQIAVDPMDRRIFVKDLVERLGGKVHPSCMKERTGTSRGCRVAWTDASLAARWHDDFGMYADKKHIAGHVFSRGREYLHGLLAGYLAGDGCLSNDTFGTVQVEFGTVSQELQNDLVSLCNILGIFAMPRKAKFNGVGCKDIYYSRISTASLSLVKPLFGYPDRQAKLESMIPSRKTRATAFDNLPVETREAKKAIYKSYPGEAPHSIYKSISSSKKVAKHRIAGCSGRVGLWANSDILWDTIVSIEEIPHQQYVYDFSVEGSEAFATANGTLVHNTAISFYPSVQVGQSVKAGDMVAHSNYTDARTGAMAMGQNLHVAISAYRGHSYEDAHTISESAARKLATDRLYSFDHETKNGVTIGRDKYIASFPSNFNKDQISTLDEHGVVKVGTVLHRGDPVVLSLGPRILSSQDKALGKLSKALRNSYMDKSEVWEHDYPGTVVDATVTSKGVKVNVSAQPPVKVGDKLSGRFGLKGVVGCYDPATEVLTSTGWKAWPDVTTSDMLAVLPDGVNGRATFARPSALHVYDHDGYLVHARTEQLDYRVTGNHRMYCRIEHYRGVKASYRIRTADDIFGKKVVHLCASEFDYNEVKSEPFDVTRYVDYDPAHEHKKSKTVFDGDDFAEFLGWYVSEGSTSNYSGTGIESSKSNVHNYKIQISQSRAAKPDNCRRIEQLLDRLGVRWMYHGTQYTFSSKPLYKLLRHLGTCSEKYLPDFVWCFSKTQLRRLFDGLMLGDGTVAHLRTVRDAPSYITTSPRLARQVEFIMTILGYNARITVDRRAGTRYEGHDGTKSASCNFDKYTVTAKACTEMGQSSATFSREQYTGKVYCATVPGGLLYVRRSGRPMWCGNSIIPDEEMPRDAATNQPYDMLVNPMGFLSRVAPGQLMEISLGKIAKKTGKQFRLAQLPPQEGWYAWTKAQMDANGVPETSDMFDPSSGKTIKGVGDGYMFVQAFHHLAEKKASAVGSDGSYTQDEQPAKGGFEGAKKMSGMDLWSMLAHNVPDVIKDSQLIRGTRNDQYWRALQLGLPVPEPEEPFIYRKFLNTLQAGGINVTEKGSIVGIMPQTDKDIDRLAKGREITSSEMVDSDFEPAKGGLFDLGKTGGMGGSQWSCIPLPEPVPNPIMEEPVRRVLGLTSSRLEDILAGRSKLDGKTGGQAIKDALAKVDVDKSIAEARRGITEYRGQKRDDAVKVYRYLSSMKKQGLSPSDWMISKVPVLPPMFRPVSRMGDVALVSDMNELYKDVIENARNFSDLRKEVSDEGLTDERLNLYLSVKAAYGLGQPITPENAAKGVKGAVRQVIGNRPKCYDSKTEVLTRRGWIPFGDVTFDDTVATVNQTTLKLEWQRPSDVIHTDYNGLMVHTLSKKIDLLVTPNHMHFIQKRVHGRLDGHKDERGRSAFLGWRKAEAASLLYDGARMHMLTAPSGYDGCGEPDFPGVKDKSAFAFICGMYVAEGWDTEYSANICQTSANPDICRMIRDAFDRSGVEYSEATFKKPHGRLSTYWSIHSKYAAEWFRGNFGHLAGGKMISETVLEWRPEYLRQLLDGYLYGDGEKLHGRKDPDTNKTFYSKDRMTCEHARANTTSKQLVDDIAELCMKIGLGFRLCSTIESDNPKWNTQYRFRVDGWNKVVVEGPKYHKWEMYSGQVHCVTVPNGLVVVRRNGLTAVSGNSGMFQSKVLSKAVNGVARGVISPDPNLDMDQCGIPDTMAWSLYRPYVMRSLVRNGYPAVEAIRMIEDRTPVAKSVMEKVMSERPVLLDRAPTWHKFNLLAFKPVLTEGNTIKVSPLITAGFTADFDGDQMNAHVPSSEKAVKQAYERMLPSRNLTSLTDLRSPRHMPSKEQIFGLYALTKEMTDKPVKVFNSVSEARQAYARGEIGPNDPIEIRR